MVAFSIALYILTFFLGLFIDNSRNGSVKKLKIFFVIWLYIFLCFGYMTGSDWSDYEVLFNSLSSFSDFQRGGESSLEFGFWSILLLFKKIFVDFFLVLGILKILYLYTTIKVLKRLTDKWLSSLSFLMPLSLCFILIDNPLKFMMSLVIVNLSLLCFLNDKRFPAFLFLFLSFFFHNTCAVFIILLPFLKKYELILKAKSIFIFIIYLVVVYLFSGDSIVGQLAEEFRLRMVLLGGKDYVTYVETQTEAFFTIGSFINIFMMALLLYLRKSIVKMPNGNLIFSCSIVYFFLFRILILIPSGFRLAVPFTYFLAAAFAGVIGSKVSVIYKWVLILFYVAMLSRKIWTGYAYIPYSNSIPYILTEHKPYSERQVYNLNEYRKRTGHEWQYFDNH